MHGITSCLLVVGINCDVGAALSAYVCVSMCARANLHVVVYACALCAYSSVLVLVCACVRARARLSVCAFYVTLAWPMLASFSESRPLSVSLGECVLRPTLNDTLLSHNMSFDYKPTRDSAQALQSVSTPSPLEQTTRPTI